MTATIIHLIITERSIIIANEDGDILTRITDIEQPIGDVKFTKPPHTATIKQIGEICNKALELIKCMELKDNAHNNQIVLH